MTNQELLCEFETRVNNGVIVLSEDIIHDNRIYVSLVDPETNYKVWVLDLVSKESLINKFMKFSIFPNRK